MRGASDIIHGIENNKGNKQMDNIEMFEEEDCDFDSSSSSYNGYNTNSYERILSEMNLPDLIDNIDETYYTHEKKAISNTHESQIELQNLFLYFSEVGNRIEQIKNNLIKDMKDVAVSRNSNELIRHIEGATGYLNYLQYKGSRGNYYTVGDENDVKETVKFANEVLDGIEGVRLFGTGALLYTKEEYYILFIIEGLDAEFCIHIPNITEYTRCEEIERAIGMDRTPSDITISIKEFGSSLIEPAATGSDVNDVNDKFKAFLNKYRNEKMNTNQYSEFIKRERDKFFSNEHHKFLLEYFEGF